MSSLVQGYIHSTKSTIVQSKRAGVISSHESFNSHIAGRHATLTDSSHRLLADCPPHSLIYVTDATQNKALIPYNYP